MKKIFRTTMAICLFIMTMLVVNTFKTQAQSVRAVEPVVNGAKFHWFLKKDIE